MKQITILGSTGSIGTQTLDVVKSLGNVSVSAITANENIELVLEQIKQFKPKLVAIFNEEKAEALKKLTTSFDVKVVSGMYGIIEAATFEEAGLVVNALVGSVGLKPTVAAIKAKKDICLANKETLVTAGEFVMRLASENKVNVLPIDSEHSAILQCLQGNFYNSIEKIHLTASGGPFLGYSRTQLGNVTVAQALKHPNWSMGKKITIDSATLMNKGLEVIEAKWLFDVPVEKINVVVHPQSIIHSMVEFTDGAVMAQLGMPDMRVPIQYALTYPERVLNDYPRLDFTKLKTLSFEQPDMEAFPCLRLAFEAVTVGGTLPAVMNAANEVCVERFLRGEIGFNQISELIEKAMQAYTVVYDYSIDDVLKADAFGRQFVTAN